MNITYNKIWRFADIPQKHEIFVQALNVLLVHLSGRGPEITTASLREFFANHGGLFCAQVSGGPLVGIATLIRLHKINGETGRLEHVVVDPAYQGNGIGRHLTKMVIVEARRIGMRYIDLTSKPSRESANHLYGTLGFELLHTNSRRLVLE